MPRKVSIPLYDGDDFDRLSELRRAVGIAERKAKTLSQESALRLGDIPDSIEADAEVRRAREAYSDAVDEAAERAETWVLQAIGHEEFRDLLAAHPPRKVTETVEGKSSEVTHPDDSGWEFNSETFPRALLTFVDAEDEEHRTVLAPFDSEAALRKRIRRLSRGEFDTLWVAAHELNTGLVADPKASGFYVGDRRSDET
jgi:hypothetical protein